MRIKNIHFAQTMYTAPWVLFFELPAEAKFRQQSHTYLLTLKKASNHNSDWTEPRSHLTASDIKNSSTVQLKLVLNTTLGNQNSAICKNGTKNTMEERNWSQHCSWVPHLLDTRTTVAGAVCVSANLLRLCRSLSSAAFLAVALMCATVTCGNTWKHSEEKLQCEGCLLQQN